jgi:hypothetical protein
MRLENTADDGTFGEHLEVINPDEEVAALVETRCCGFSAARVRGSTPEADQPVFEQSSPEP